MEYRLRLVPGKKSNSTILCDENSFTFHKDGVNTQGLRKLRCSKSRGPDKCKFRLIAQPNGNYRHAGLEHNHENDEAELKNFALLAEAFRRAPIDGRLARHVFEDVRAEIPGANIGYNQNVQRAMQRAQRKAEPANPASVAEAIAMLAANERYRKALGSDIDFFDGLVSTETQDALVFISCPAVLSILGTTSEIYCDATFATLPAGYSQLFTVHVSAHGHIFPIAYAMMTGKSESLYDLIFARILQKLDTFFPGDGNVVRLMISDFEFAILNSSKKAFPEGRARGCWFHFGQAIYRRICREGLQVAYARPNVQKVVKLLIALALLPSESILEGFELIRTNSVALLEAETEEVKNAFVRTFEYFQNYWIAIVTPLKFCVSGDGRRTNNEVEGFHRWFNRRCDGQHQNFWKFIRHLQKVERDVRVDSELAATSKTIRRPQVPNQRYIDRTIVANQEMLANGRVNIYHFLEMCSNFFEPARQPAENPPMRARRRRGP